MRVKLDKMLQRTSGALGQAAQDRVPRTVTRSPKATAGIKTTGGAGQFGEGLRVAPLPRGKGYEFVDKVKAE